MKFTDVKVILSETKKSTEINDQLLQFVNTNLRQIVGNGYKLSFAIIQKSGKLKNLLKQKGITKAPVVRVNGRVSSGIEDSIKLLYSLTQTPTQSAQKTAPQNSNDMVGIISENDMFNDWMSELKRDEKDDDYGGLGDDDIRQRAEAFEERRKRYSQRRQSRPSPPPMEERPIDTSENIPTASNVGQPQQAEPATSDVNVLSSINQAIIDTKDTSENLKDDLLLAQLYQRI